jgi:hypothetical protein
VLSKPSRFVSVAVPENVGQRLHELVVKYAPRSNAG